MAYTNASEEKKWKIWKEQEEHKLRELGMDETFIQELRRRDREDFNEERRYREHRALYPIYEDSMAVEMEELEVYRIDNLLHAIDNEQLLHILEEADEKMLRILILKMMGFSVQEIAEKLQMSVRSIYCRIDRLKKKIKKIL
ncbi:HTH domain-containing protein [[Clostridium] scindens]|uniref:HTH domain-containing protein n=1 Tax=Clostridium scindens (strain JCM 10418 / VPI 12708) TaxID=29347 RepID=UPI001D079999|nr:HTH domain-containing protein [[Clostridium] scindens]MCB6286248.1 HTH domain-containing protein [[Clostridium] scindens]MCB6421004.1 HTH domain-containing protein [[Clostridium] scindens]MCB7192763.1 HTH domain-containing protein [[Clostridium] scindens]MCB7285947.1 HTH domain-containing protein [[Clostridium] scindens]MCG4929925.1 HTH domain-containing protein [[Clostridium] scindens]